MLLFEELAPRRSPIPCWTKSQTGRIHPFDRKIRRQGAIFSASFLKQVGREALIAMDENKRRHVFISHHHADDAEVDNLTSLLKKRGYDIRNSSIRAKPANQQRLDKGLVKEETIRRLLRMKISWASEVVVLVGKQTHSRPWVNWEVEEANRQGKRIVGVYAHGSSNADKPPALEKYASAIVGWNTGNIVSAIDGTENSFQNPDGTSRVPPHAQVTVVC
jgi:MTH538 TIR-like domain (DUF1863)